MANISKISQNKELKYIHCSKFNYIDNNCFIFHLNKWLLLDKNRVLKAKITKV